MDKFDLAAAAALREALETPREGETAREYVQRLRDTDDYAAMDAMRLWVEHDRRRQINDLRARMATATTFDDLKRCMLDLLGVTCG